MVQERFKMATLFVRYHLQSWSVEFGSQVHVDIKVLTIHILTRIRYWPVLPISPASTASTAVWIPQWTLPCHDLPSFVINRWSTAKKSADENVCQLLLIWSQHWIWQAQKMFKFLTTSTSVYYDTRLTAHELSLFWKIRVDIIQNQMQNWEMWLLRHDQSICKIFEVCKAVTDEYLLCIWTINILVIQTFPANMPYWRFGI